MIVLHYTDMTSAEAAILRLCDPEAKVSAHYLIAADGTVTQMVEENRRAWHAGVSAWFGATDLNSRSIGIELDSPGHRPGAPIFPDRQIAVLLALLSAVRGRWRVPLRNVVAHSDIAPHRKVDPGEAFPWQRLAAAGHAIYVPAPDAPGAASPVDPAVLIPPLTRCGYTFAAGADPAPVVDAFHRRHVPALTGAPPTEASLQVARALAAVIDAETKTEAVAAP
ncbi:N-acetylmuramoyl-L-alanine amidase [Stappia sp. 22II-S9-Z10]|nr:N-acetylmuramoyl-L-alanine amidase [Stappia sp. 22II-S9-Z10]